MLEQLVEPQLINTGDVDNPVPVSQAILEGYAPGTELYSYAEYPQITPEELAMLAGENYQEVFYAVTKKLLGGSIPDEVLQETAREAYSPENFDLEDGNLRFTTLSSGIHVVGLSDGPTAAFKDMAMQPLARWMSYLQSEKGIPLTILLSTSGDTGPAALKAFGGMENTEIINLLPKEGVSPFQWAQMAELGEQDGIHVLEMGGGFGDLNKIQMEVNSEFELGTVNSVNIGRIIAQVPYYVASYLKAIEVEDKQIGDPVDVSIPSGNFGNALSAIIAREMGVPFRNIIVATNENDTLDHMFKTGEFNITPYRETDSSAQDIDMPSNVWRYFGMMYGNDPEKVARVYSTLKEFGSVALGDIGVENEGVLDNVISSSITRKQRMHAIRDIYWGSGGEVILDPHTANGVAAIRKLWAKDPGVPMLAMETAKPFKFDAAVYSALGIMPPRPDRFQGLEDRQMGKRLGQVANRAELLAFIAEHTHAKSRIAV